MHEPSRFSASFDERLLIFGWNVYASQPLEAPTADASILASTAMAALAVVARPGFTLGEGDGMLLPLIVAVAAAGGGGGGGLCGATQSPSRLPTPLPVLP